MPRRPLIATVAATGALALAVPAGAAATTGHTIVVIGSTHEVTMAYDGVTGAKRVLLPPYTDFPKESRSQPAGGKPYGRDVNGQVCFDPTDHGRMVDADDRLQEKGFPPGWSVQRLHGKRFATLSSRAVGWQVPDYQAAPDNYGCGFLSNGVLLTTSIGDRYPGQPGNGELYTFFPPLDNGDPNQPRHDQRAHTRFCVIDATLATPGGIYVDPHDNVYVATNRPDDAGHVGGIYKYSGRWPTSDTKAGGCGGPPDGTGAPTVTPGRITKTLFIPFDAHVPTPSAITASGHGTFYVSSVFSGTIAEYDDHGAFVRMIVQPPPGDRMPYKYGTPYGVAVDSHGTLYYADLGIALTPVPDAAPEQGAYYRVRFDHAGRPLTPEVIDDHLDFPDGLGILELVHGRYCYSGDGKLHC